VSGSRKLLDAWLPPQGAGRAVACLATSYTFDPDFFETDCLARFLSLDWKRGEGDDLAFLVEQEERLAETRATVIVDHGYNPEARSLRWDIVPLGVRGGVQHSKVSLLVWDRIVRFIVASANLTPAGYRRQLECGFLLDAFDGSDVPAQVFDELVEALKEIVALAPGDATRPGPKQRAVETLDLAADRITGLELATPSRKGLRLAVAMGAPGRPVLGELARVWKGGPPRRAFVLSPFFDTGEERSAAASSLAEHLARRGSVAATFVVPVDDLAGRTIVRAPRAILASLPKRVQVAFCSVREPGDVEPRRLHAKATLLESEEWTALVVGSSNFTAAGLGLLRGAGNLELNLAVGAPARSAEAEAFRSLIPVGDSVVPDEVEWEPEPDDETGSERELPAGFVECLLDPGQPPCLIVRLLPSGLPGWWAIRRVEGDLLADHSAWTQAGCPEELRIALPGEKLPFVVEVEWLDGETRARAGWPVNVTEPGLLPPPDELRDLPVEALLRALASTRPMHEALSAALRQQQRIAANPELDPLRRYSDSGQLFARARRLSAALIGLRRRLERPASNLDALTWRLKGPFGPVELAKRMLEEADESGKAIPGESSFLIAELALTLARVDWASTARILPPEVVLEEAHGVLTEVKQLGRMHTPSDPALAGYIRRALAEARL
jgi:hypothetical protein